MSDNPNPTPISSERIAELRRLHAKGCHCYIDRSGFTDRLDRCVRCERINDDLPALLAEIDRLRIVIQTYEATMPGVYAERDALRAECERLKADVDPPVCRLQFPDGSVPGNVRQCAEGWRTWHEKTAAEVNRLRELANKQQDRLEAALESNRLLRAAVERYGHHDTSCLYDPGESWPDGVRPEVPCNCGLSAALAAIRERAGEDKPGDGNVQKS